MRKWQAQRVGFDKLSLSGTNGKHRLSLSSLQSRRPSKTTPCR